MTQIEAENFSYQWLSAWNSHDLDAILDHYAETIEFTSPFAVQLMGGPLIQGREALRAYFSRALERFPSLHFSNPTVLVGANSVVLCYRSVNNLDAAETMLFDESGRVCRVWAHYRAQPEPSPIG